MARECYLYSTVCGDTFDSIALEFYGDENLSFIIMQLNPDLIRTVIFDAGIQVKIPKLELKDKSTLPPWKVNK